MQNLKHAIAIITSAVCIHIGTTVAAETFQITAQPLAVALTDDVVYLPDPLPALPQSASRTAERNDIFGQAMDDKSLRAAAGGTADYAIDLAGLGINNASTVSTISDNSADNSVTGEVMGNMVSNNSGFTTVVFNSGNQVVFNNTVQVNVFTGSN